MIKNSNQANIFYTDDNINSMGRSLYCTRDKCNISTVTEKPIEVGGKLSLAGIPHT